MESHVMPHGDAAGHAIPGGLFIAWSLYWFLCIFRDFHKSPSAFHCKAFHPWPFRGGPRLLYAEPVLVIVGSLLGTLNELRIGSDTWISPYDAEGKLDHDGILAWQHTMMYLAFGASGCVDLLGTQLKLPRGAEQAFLGIAFLCESVLMGFHLNRDAYVLDYNLHLLLVFLMLACAGACFLELARPTSVLAATSRALCTFVQGTWFCQVGHILFEGVPAWDVGDPHGAMLVPVVFATHLLLACLGALGLFLATGWWYKKPEGASAAKASGAGQPNGS